MIEEALREALTQPATALVSKSGEMKSILGMDWLSHHHSPKSDAQPTSTSIALTRYRIPGSCAVSARCLTHALSENDQQRIHAARRATKLARKRYSSAQEMKCSPPRDALTCVVGVVKGNNGRQGSPGGGVPRRDIGAGLSACQRGWRCRRGERCLDRNASEGAGDMAERSPCGSLSRIERPIEASPDGIKICPACFPFLFLSMFSVNRIATRKARPRRSKKRHPAKLLPSAKGSKARSS
eukprot:scaffold2808_cov255-Pinguiococcus_pyrenoidosus.AAC.11